MDPSSKNVQSGAYNALAMSAPVMAQINPEGRWQSNQPGSEDMNEKTLQAVVQHIIKSKALSGGHSYCPQCAAESMKSGKAGEKHGATSSNYIPIIMMPIYSADQCPFNFDCNTSGYKKIEKTTTQSSDKKKKGEEQEGVADSDTPQKKPKRGFVLQRFTNFDLMSQW